MEGKGVVIVNRSPIRGPELKWVGRTELSLLMLLISAVGCCLLALRIGWGWPLLGLSLGYLLVLEMVNELRRFKWVRTFDGVRTLGGMRPVLYEDPARYRLHAFFNQGTDQLFMRPSIVIEDVEAGSLFGIYPGSYGALGEIYAMGIQESGGDLVQSG
jgi:hypothetical protein